MVTNESLSKIVDKDVFTDNGVYCGKITDLELDLEKFRVRAVIIAAKGSYLSKYVGTKKGIVVPFQMVNSIGDVVIIKNITSALPTVDEPEPQMPMSGREQERMREPAQPRGFRPY